MRTVTLNFGREKHYVASEACVRDRKGTCALADIQDKHTLYLIMNNYCNANCDFCSCGQNENRVVVNPKKFFRDTMWYIGEGYFKSLAITGGEPLLDMAELKEILTVMPPNIILSITLNTNGTYLNKHNLDILGRFKNLKRINISVNGETPEERSRRMGLPVEKLFNVENFWKICPRNMMNKFTVSYVVDKTWTKDKIVRCIRQASRYHFGSVIFRWDMMDPNDIEINRIFQELKSHADSTKTDRLSDKCNCYEFYYFGLHIMCRIQNHHKEEVNELVYSEYCRMRNNLIDRAEALGMRSNEISDYLKKNLPYTKGTNGYLRNFVYHPDNTLRTGWHEDCHVLPYIAYKAPKPWES